MTKPDFVITNADYLGRQVDVVVAAGRIVELASAGGSYGDVITSDAGGSLLLPALTDTHTHLREPGYEWKEDIASGLKAAAYGGFANIMCMANTNPVNDNASVTEFMLKQAKEVWPLGPRLFPVAGLTKGLKGEELAELWEMQQAGCVAASNDGVGIRSAELFSRAMEYAADLGMIVIDHCEDPDIAPHAGINEGEISTRMGLKGAPTAGEAIQVARDILLAEYLDIPVHLAHISCRQSVELIAFAKKRGVPVTAETCPHFLLLTQDAALEYNTSAKVNPPLRTKEDVQSLCEALNNGTIDILCTDHAPHADHEKEQPFVLAPNGLSGLDTALPLTMQMVKDKILSLKTLIRAWCTRPAEIFGLPHCTFEPGDPADFLLYDTGHTWELTPENMYSKGKNTAFMGLHMPGRVKALYVEGKQVV